MRVTKRTNIAMRVLMYCAANEGHLVPKADIATRCNASENHLAQVIHQLAQLNVLYTQRGRNGGLSLAHSPKDIVIGDIFRAIEGPVPIVECFADADDSCPLVASCRLRGALTAAAESFYEHLDEITLADLVCDNVQLLDLLTDATCTKVAPTHPVVSA